MTTDHYILIDRRPVPEPDLMTWARWLETADRRVALTEHELFSVSTIFLGLNHQFGRGPPLLFESMAFLNMGSPGDSERIDPAFYCARYANWEVAELGHKAMVARCTQWAREAAGCASGI